MATSMGGRAARVQQEGKRIAHKATTSPLMENLLRLGYVVRGVIYGAVGLLALQAALGGKGAITDLQGAIAKLGQSTLGGIVLYAILVGLVGYGLWGFIRAITDPLHKGTDAKGIAERIGYALSGVSYLLLAFTTYGLITGSGSAARSGGQTAQTQQTAGRLLSQPWGTWVLGIVAVIIIGVGLLQILRGLRQDFDQQFNPYALSSEQRKGLNRLGQFGTAARGFVFTLIGLFLFQAAYRNDPSLAKGIDGVLTALLQQPYGLWLLGIVALGLIAFGVYSAMSGVLLRIRR